MKVAIFGASGRIGTKLVAEMLRRGHKVTAFVYGPNPFAPDNNLKVVQGDVHNESEVAAAIKGSHAIMSALGSWGTDSKDILSSAMTHIVPAMKKQKISRIISLTGADARDITDTPDLLQKASYWLFMRIAPKIMLDGEKHIKILRESKLHWTVLRSPVMTDRGKLGSPILNLHPPKPWAKIHRADVVKAMCDLAESQDHNQSAPFIHQA